MKCSYYPVAEIPHPTLVKYISRESGFEKHVSMPLSEVWWSIFVNGKQGIFPNNIDPHWHSPKDTHQGKLRTKNWSYSLNLRQEYPSHMCTQDGNSNKGCYLPRETYLGIVSVPDCPGCLVRQVTPPWTHPIWYGDSHLSGVYVCFTTQGSSSVWPSLFFQIKSTSSL